MTPTGIHLVAVLFPIVGLAQTSLDDDDRTNHSLSTFKSGPKTDQGDNDEILGVKETIKTAYAYLRQSQTSEGESEENSSSIHSQKQTTTKVSKEHDYDNLKFFKDVNESGFSFDREGFQRLEEALEREPRPVILDRIDRLGRDTLETVYNAAVIHYTYDVPIITAEHGEYELEKIDEQLDLVLNAIVAGKSVKNRIRAAWNSIKMRFGDERKWGTWFDNIPVGYQSDDDEWIEPAPHAEEVISAIINELLDTENRSKTAKQIGKVANNESLNCSPSDGDDGLAGVDPSKVRAAFEGSDYDPAEFTGSQLKRLLTNPLLIGEIRFPRNAPREEQDSIEESSLQVVDEDLFKKVNTSIEEKAAEQSTDTDKNVDMDTLAELGILLLAVDETEVIKPVCPECNQGMVKNGEDTEHPLEDGRVAHYWICPKYTDGDTGGEGSGAEYDCQRKVPYKQEWDALKEHFEEEDTDGKDIVTLKICPPEA